MAPSLSCPHGSVALSTVQRTVVDRSNSGYPYCSPTSFVNIHAPSHYIISLWICRLCCITGTKVLVMVRLVSSVSASFLLGLFQPVGNPVAAEPCMPVSSVANEVYLTVLTRSNVQVRPLTYMFVAQNLVSIYIRTWRSHVREA